MTTPPKAMCMKRSPNTLRIFLIAAVAAMMLAFVPLASAASTDQIIQDAKDGQI